MIGRYEPVSGRCGRERVAQDGGHREEAAVAGAQPEAQLELAERQTLPQAAAALAYKLEHCFHVERFRRRRRRRLLAPFFGYFFLLSVAHCDWQSLQATTTGSRPMIAVTIYTLWSSAAAVIGTPIDPFLLNRCAWKHKCVRLIKTSGWRPAGAITNHKSPFIFEAAD